MEENQMEIEVARTSISVAFSALKSARASIGKIGLDNIKKSKRREMLGMLKEIEDQVEKCYKSLGV